MMTPTQSPAEVRRYYLAPPEKSFEWAEVIITSGGFFSAVSDYGNYAFAWRSFGDRDFRSFLLNAEKDVDYFTKKLQHGGDGPGDVYDGEPTVRAIKEHILRHRRDLSWTAESAREQWDLLSRHDVEDNEVEFGAWYRETDIADAYEFAHRKRNPQAKAFVERILVARLCPIFRAELAAQNAASAVRAPSVGDPVHDPCDCYDDGVMPVLGPGCAARRRALERRGGSGGGT